MIAKPLVSRQPGTIVVLARSIFKTSSNWKAEGFKGITTDGSPPFPSASGASGNVN